MDTFTPDEFARRLRLRGIAKNIDDARKYISCVNKEFYTEEDFVEAYYVLNHETIGARKEMLDYTPIVGWLR